jgi:hypothetical protein
VFLDNQFYELPPFLLFRVVSDETATGVTQVLTDHARAFEEKMGTLLARLDTIVTEMDRSTQSGSEQLSATISEVVARLEQAVSIGSHG